MVVNLPPQLETALNKMALRQGIAPEVLALNVLQERILTADLLEPRDEWQRGLRQVATDCGVSLPNEALSSEGIYE